MKLSGNTIFITGGGSGIGRGLAEALHKLGNKVIIAGRRRSNLDAVITANPGMAAVELDITDPTSINQVAAKLIAEHPDLNVLINNAGIMQPDAASGRRTASRKYAPSRRSNPYSKDQHYRLATASGCTRRSVHHAKIPIARHR